MKAPSKKIILILIASVAAVGAVFIAVRGGKDARPAEVQKESIAVVTERIGAADTDGDGLKDWEEALWKTDHKNPDTDGDGTEDGDEIRQSRNPAVKGPNDKVSSTTPATVSTTTDLTSTDILARDFMNSYMDMKRRGIEVDQKTEVELIQKVLESQSLKINAKMYSLADLKLVNDTTDARKAYGNALGESLRKNSPKNSDSELNIVSSAVQDNDDSRLAKLDPIIAGYDALLKDYLKVSVPKGAARSHLQLVNSISALLEDIRAMRGLTTDPVKAYAGVNDYKTSVVALARSIYEISMYFKANNVFYGKDEEGYNFTKVISI